ncbi:MAG: rubredoxin [Clostridiales bacterium]|nr:rubredoxin [Clostridiales bacterium]
MKKYECISGAYIYDPAEGDIDSGIEPNTPFEDVPEDWVCPVCGSSKDTFDECE